MGEGVVVGGEGVYSSVGSVPWWELKRASLGG